MKFIKTYFSGLALLLLLTGCALAINQPTSAPLTTDVAIATVKSAAGTTVTPTKTVTPIPPPTRRATATNDVNVTITITLTPLASFTIRPTVKVTRTPSPTITGTNTLYVRPPLFFGTLTTPTPIPYKCKITDSNPNEGEILVLKPRTDFVAKWKIQNIGANMWHIDDILFDYVSGTKMHNNTRVGTILSETIYVGEHINIQVHMKPPKEPGLYTETWGLRKTNKTEFFCLLTVTVQVVGK